MPEFAEQAHLPRLAKWFRGGIDHFPPAIQYDWTRDGAARTAQYLLDHFCDDDTEQGVEAGDVGNQVRILRVHAGPAEHTRYDMNAGTTSVLLRVFIVWHSEEQMTGAIAIEPEVHTVDRGDFRHTHRAEG